MIGWAARRLLLVPALLVLTVLALVMVPVSALLSLFAVLGGRPRWRLLRVATFAAVYSVAECVAVVACLGLWLASPLPRRRSAARWRARHARLLRLLLDALLGAAEWVFDFQLELEEPEGPGPAPDQPLLVLGRHAGPGASLVLVHVLMSRRGRVPRIVAKTQLRVDPALDLLLSRLGCAFIAPHGGAQAATAAVAALAADLHPDDALVIFPEGSDWTPTRHRMAVLRLRRKGLRAQARAAAAMPHVLPPRPAGTYAALSAAPAAALAVFMHTGHDLLLDVGSVWSELPLRRALQMVWWQEPRPALADEAECAEWLSGLWGRIDGWIDLQLAATPALGS